MRISDPKLFNGQTLTTKQQISAWLAGTSDDSFGILSIPASNVKYGTNSNVSAQIANIYTKLGLDNSGEGGDETLLSRVATIENAIKVDANGNYIVAGSNVNTNLSNLDTNLKTVSGDLDTLETTVGELSSWKGTFVDQTAVVEGTGLAEVITGDVVNGVQTFTVNVSSEASFTNHTIKLAKLEEAETGYASSYQLMVDGAKQGDIINIPKDQFLKGAEIVEGTYADGVFTASEDGNKYIHFTFEIKVKDVALAETTQEKHIYLDIQELCDIYTGGNGITIASDNTIAVKANAAKAIEVSTEGVAVKVDGETIVFTEGGALKAVIPEVEVPVQSVSGGIGITEISTTGNVVLNLDVAKSDEIGGVKSDGDISVAADTGIVSVLSARFADVAGKVENALTAFGKAYDGSEVVTVSGKTDTEKYITYSQAAGVFTVGAQGLDVDADGNYVLSSNTVAANLTALDTAVKAAEHSHATLTIGSKTYNTSANVTVTAADLGALTGAVAGNAGIEVSKTDGEVSISAVVKEGDLHLGIGETGIETKGLTVATDGNYVKTANTVAANLTALDTQVKANADAIATNAAAISEITLVEVEFTVNGDGDYTLGFAGKVLQVFDADGVCYPEIKYVDGVATISIGKDATAANKAANYTAIVSKKQVKSA